MSEPPTVLIREPDDDTTIVDPRFSIPRTERPFEGSGRARSSSDRSLSLAEAKRSLWRCLRAMLPVRLGRAVETGVLVALAFGLASLAYQQRRSADALRGALAAMKVARPGSPSQDLTSPESRAQSPVGTESEAEPSVGADEREELERRGASLLGSNNFAGALTHYQTLVELFPEEAVFRDVVTVLEAKLRCVGPVSSQCP